MKKWTVSIPVGTSVFVTIDAEDADAAIEAADGYLPGLCAQCSGWGQDYSRDEWEPDWDAAEASEVEA